MLAALLIMTALPGNVVVAPGRSDLPTATLSHPQSGASCEVILGGAHVTSWKAADGIERLFVSSASKYGAGAAIRGGIPVCWPQFSDRGSLPKHGFLRTSDEWEIEQMETGEDGAAQLVLCLKDSETSRAVWPHAFKVTYCVTLTAATLTTVLEVFNAGGEPIEFTTALHTYFAVPDVASVRVVGLQGLQYEDNTAGRAVSREEPEELAISGEVDRVYIDAPERVVLRTPERAELIVEKSTSFRDLVVWNLGEAKAPSMADLGEGEWRPYVCLEAAAIAKPVQLPAGESFSAKQVFTVQGL